MREAIGGTFLFNLVLVFLGVFVTIITFAIVYVRAFNSRNYIINLLEQFEGYDNANGRINAFMAGRAGGLEVTPDMCVNLYKNMYSKSMQDNDFQIAKNVWNVPGGCIYQKKESDGKSYVVTTYMRVDIPVISSLMQYFPITGETRVIYE